MNIKNTQPWRWHSKVSILIAIRTKQSLRLSPFYFAKATLRVKMSILNATHRIPELLKLGATGQAAIAGVQGAEQGGR